MDALAFIDAQNLRYTYSDGTYAVMDDATQGTGDSLEAALADYVGGLADKRAQLTAPLDAYVATGGADAAVVKAVQDGAQVVRDSTAGVKKEA